MNINPYYFLDPDNRKDDPKEGLFCCRCKKPLVEGGDFFSVELHPENPWVRKNSNGDSNIGANCWKKITKEYSPIYA